MKEGLSDFNCMRCSKNNWSNLNKCGSITSKFPWFHKNFNHNSNVEVGFCLYCKKYKCQMYLCKININYCMIGINHWCFGKIRFSNNKMEFMIYSTSNLNSKKSYINIMSINLHIGNKFHFNPHKNWICNCIKGDLFYLCCRLCRKIHLNKINKNYYIHYSYCLCLNRSHICNCKLAEMCD